MQFIWPVALWLLLLVPALVALYVLAQRRRQRYALRYASLSLLREAVGRGPGWRRHVPPALYITAMSFMLVALARPQAVVTLPSEEGTVILTIDVSGSMMADDLKPSRMEAAKAAAKAFVAKQPDNARIGVVSFSDEAFVVQAPTSDRDAVRAAINRLQPQRGTAIGRGILVSLDAIFENSDDALPSTLAPQAPGPGQQPQQRPRATARSAPAKLSAPAPATIILLTDGENNIFPPPLAVVDIAAQRGVRIYTVGVGSAEGTILRIQGRAIRTRLDEDTLRQVADATDAHYFNAANEEDLRQIYESLTTHIVLRTERTEITAAFAALAVVLLLLSGGLSLLWFNRLP